jgi:hypothetical protein
VIVEFWYGEDEKRGNDINLELIKNNFFVSYFVTIGANVIKLFTAVIYEFL